MPRMPFHVTSSAEPRPASHATIYCDGTGGDAFREGVDIELSHWIPNRTPPRLRADSSTEICLKFAAEGMSRSWDLAVNNHLDVDGILSTYAVVEPSAALAHRETLIGAAEMGDFWAWAPEPSQALFQGLTLLVDECNGAGVDPLVAYRRAFAAIPALLAPDAARDARLRPGLDALRASTDLLDSGAVAATVHGAAFAAFVVPRSASRDDLERALHVPAFNEALSPRALLWPQARARDHGTKVQFVSVEGADGWFHDLWYPGYAWAQTVRRPRPRGLVLPKDAAEQVLRFPELSGAVDALQRAERSAGRWTIASAVSAFDGLPGRGFPVVVSFTGDDGRPAPSSVAPDDAASRLAAPYA